LDSWVFGHVGIWAVGFTAMPPPTKSEGEKATILRGDNGRISWINKSLCQKLVDKETYQFQEPMY